MSTLLLSARVDRIYWYLMRDYREFTGIGLVRSESDPMGPYVPAPAYVAYANLIHQLDGADFVRREPSDPRTHIYLFSENGREVRVAWSAAPGATYDIASDEPIRLANMMGKEASLSPKDGRISIPLGENPIYLLGRATSIAGPAIGQPIASSADDFSLTQGMAGWSYGAMVRPDAPLAVGAAMAEPFEPLGSNQTHDAWVRVGSPTLQIRANMMHPGRARDVSVWAVRRWSSSVDGAIRVTGMARVDAKKSDGVRFALSVDGHVVYLADIGGAGPANQARFDIPLKVSRDAKIDFAVGPGARGINFDATGISILIARDSAR
jgi:hypothetical protein